jgi:hypothetical protein
MSVTFLAFNNANYPIAVDFKKRAVRNYIAINLRILHFFFFKEVFVKTLNCRVSRVDYSAYNNIINIKRSSRVY